MTSKTVSGRRGDPLGQRAEPACSAPDAEVEREGASHQQQVAAEGP
jgi:hypothetical protein